MRNCSVPQLCRYLIFNPRFLPSFLKITHSGSYFIFVWWAIHHLPSYPSAVFFLIPLCPLPPSLKPFPSTHFFIIPLRHRSIPRSISIWWITVDLLSLTWLEISVTFSKGHHMNAQQTHTLNSALPHTHTQTFIWHKSWLTSFICY